jgi:iron(III) transport system permease protein
MVSGLVGAIRARTGEAGSRLDFLKGHSMVAFYLFLFAFFVVTVIGPMLLLFKGSFWTAGPFESGGHFTLEHYAETYFNPQTYFLFINTTVVAVGTTIFACTLGVGMAWVVARTNTPFRSWLIPMVLFPQLVPGYLVATSYIYILDPQIGFLSQILQSTIGWAPTIYSFWGIIFVSGISRAPIPFVITLPVFRNFDPALEEASRMNGAGTFQTLRKITLPMVTPAVSGAALLIFTKSLETFSVPAFLGIPADPPILVFAVRLWQAFSQEMPPAYGLGTALSTTLLAIGATGLVVQRYATSQKEKYVTVTGQGFTAERYDLGRWKWGTFSVALAVLFFGILLPFGMLLIASVTSTWFGKLFFMSDLVSFTLDNYLTLSESPDILLAITNSLIIASIGAFLAMLFASFTSYFVIKIQEDESPLIARSSGLMDQVTYLPAAIPGIVTSVGFLWFAVSIPQVGIYGSIWLIMLAYMVREFPEGTRTTHAAVSQIDAVLEDQARIAGAGWLRTIKDIILPLINRSFVAGYLLIFADLMKNLAVPLLLYDQDSIVIPVLIFTFKLSGEFGKLAALGMVLFVLVMAVFAIAKYALGVSFAE